VEWEGVDWFGDEVKSLLIKLRSLDFDFSLRNEEKHGNGYVAGKDGKLPKTYRDLGKKILKLAPTWKQSSAELDHAVGGR
jgi:hypothetical protein